MILLGTFLLVFVGVSHFAGRRTDNGPLGQVQARAYYESSGNSAWLGGFWDGINLPSSSTPEEVLRKYFPATQPYTIIEVRKIDMPVTTLFAALVEAEGKRQVVLLEYKSDMWMAREEHD